VLATAAVDSATPPVESVLQPKAWVLVL
jgi:hypothetical protein